MLTNIENRLIIIVIFIVLVSTIVVAYEGDAVSHLNQRLESYEDYTIKLAIVTTSAEVGGIVKKFFSEADFIYIYVESENVLKPFFAIEGGKEIIKKELPQIDLKQLQISPLAAFENFVDALVPSSDKVKAKKEVTDIEEAWIHGPIEGVRFEFEEGSYLGKTNYGYRFVDGRWQWSPHGGYKIPQWYETTTAAYTYLGERKAATEWDLIRTLQDATYEQGVYNLIERTIKNKDGWGKSALIVHKDGKKITYEADDEELIKFRDILIESEDWVSGPREGIFFEYEEFASNYCYKFENGRWIIAKNKWFDDEKTKWNEIEYFFTGFNRIRMGGKTEEFLEDLYKVEYFYQRGLEKLVTRTMKNKGGILLVYKNNILVQTYKQGNNKLGEIKEKLEEEFRNSLISGHSEVFSFEFEDGTSYPNKIFRFKNNQWKVKLVRIGRVGTEKWYVIEEAYKSNRLSLSPVDKAFLKNFQEVDSYEEGLKRLAERTKENKEYGIYGHTVLAINEDEPSREYHVLVREYAYNDPDLGKLLGKLKELS